MQDSDIDRSSGVDAGRSCCPPSIPRAVWQVASSSSSTAQLRYQLVPDFLKLASNSYFSEVSGVALNSRGHVFVFQRGTHPLVEFDENGEFVRTMGESLFNRPHGLRVDASDNLWVTDNGAHFVLKLNPEGRILMVLGQKDYPGNDHSHFDGPDDVAFGKSGEIYVADGADCEVRSRRQLRSGVGTEGLGERGISSSAHDRHRFGRPGLRGRS